MLPLPLPRLGKLTSLGASALGSTNTTARLSEPQSAKSESYAVSKLTTGAALIQFPQGSPVLHYNTEAGHGCARGGQENCRESFPSFALKSRMLTDHRFRRRRRSRNPRPCPLTSLDLPFPALTLRLTLLRLLLLRLQLLLITPQPAPPLSLPLLFFELGSSFSGYALSNIEHRLSDVKEKRIAIP